MKIKEINGGVCAPAGFWAGASYAGIREAKKDDLILIMSEVPSAAAGVFTKNRVKAWCVKHNHRRLEQGFADGVICNAGNANCMNGTAGKEADCVLETTGSAIIGKILGNAAPRILTASTGVIGRRFPVEKLKEASSSLELSLGTSVQHGEKAAHGIMTTDLKVKMCAVEIETTNGVCRLGGIAKGSGMIAPRMGTMLAFITCDAVVDHLSLQNALGKAADRTFNRVVVDGDTSTNDMALVLANGKSGVAFSDENELEEALEYVCRRLAVQIAGDGEGATKLISIVLKSPPDGAEKIARCIAESPLVKTACFGNDPNWGRILAAAGRSGVEFDPKRLRLRIAGYEVFHNGEPAAFDENVVSKAMQSKELVIELEFEEGEGAELCFWTCDFSYDYVKINAEYRT